MLQAAAANKPDVVLYLLEIERNKPSPKSSPPPPAQSNGRSSAKGAVDASSAAPNRSGTTPLMAAAGAGAEPALRALLTSDIHRARVADTDRRGCTALHLAVTACVPGCAPQQPALLGSEKSA